MFRQLFERFQNKKARPLRHMNKRRWKSFIDEIGKKYTEDAVTKDNADGWETYIPSHNITFFYSTRMHEKLKKRKLPIKIFTIAHVRAQNMYVYGFDVILRKETIVRMTFQAEPRRLSYSIEPVEGVERLSKDDVIEVVKHAKSIYDICLNLPSIRLRALLEEVKVDSSLNEVHEALSIPSAV
jgi:hypothetical protein